MASSYVQVTGVPASASPQELRDLFGQLGEVVHVVASFEGGAEGSALVVYSDPAAAQEAVDLLDSYPMGTSLLEVQVGAGCRALVVGAGRRTGGRWAPSVGLAPSGGRRQLLCWHAGGDRRAGCRPGDGCAASCCPNFALFCASFVISPPTHRR